MGISFEYDCGCGLSDDEQLELLQTSPAKLSEWHQVKVTKQLCRTCSGKQQHLFRRIKKVEKED